MELVGRIDQAAFCGVAFHGLELWPDAFILQPLLVSPRNVGALIHPLEGEVDEIWSLPKAVGGSPDMNLIPAILPDFVSRCPRVWLALQKWGPGFLLILASDARWSVFVLHE